MSVLSAEEVVRRVFDARARGDVRRVGALLDPDVVAQLTDDGGVARGVAAARDLLAHEATGERRVELDAHRVERGPGGALLVFGRIRVLDRGGLADSPAVWRVVVRRGRLLGVAPEGAATALRRVA